MKIRRKKLWTLLVLILLISATLFALSHTPFGRKGDSHRAGNQIKAVSVSIERYIQSHSSRLPSFENIGSLETMLLPYLMTPGENGPRFGGFPLSLPLLARPETGEPYLFNPSVSGKLRSQFPAPRTVIAFYESREKYGGRLVAFLDGHHTWVTTADWEKMRVTNGF